MKLKQKILLWTINKIMSIDIKPKKLFRCWKDKNLLCLARNNHDWEFAIYNSKINFSRNKYLKKEIAKIGIWKLAKLEKKLCQ